MINIQLNNIIIVTQKQTPCINTRFWAIVSPTTSPIMSQAMDTNLDVEKQEYDPTSSSPNPSPQSPSTSTPSRYSNCKFAFKNISYSVETPNGKKQILTDISGCVEKGNIIVRSVNLTNRLTPSLDGPLWMWQNNALEHPFQTLERQFRHWNSTPRRLALW